MLCLNLTSTDPFFNLAVEECLLKKNSGEYLILYTNTPSVIIGKHQVAHREADTSFITKNNIPVIRRISGGGTVYHDEGNLNFTFIIQSSKGDQVDFRKYSGPVVEFLGLLGVNASFEGRNDLKVNGLKISGNAEHIYHERVLHHGTLLFDADLENLRASIRKDTSHYSTRAVVSNPSSVMNLKKTCPEVKDINEFRLKMLDYFLSKPENSIFEMTPELYDSATSLAELKFRTWEWNYAYGPEYHFNNRFELNGKQISCHLLVRDGIIHHCDIEGPDKLHLTGKKLIGSRHMPDDLTKLLRNEEIVNGIVEWIF